MTEPTPGNGMTEAQLVIAGVLAVSEPHENPIVLDGYFVYQLFTRYAETLYVGMTSDLVSRMKAHRRTKPWWSDVRLISFARYGTRREAEEVEADLIADEFTRWNVAGRPDWEHMPEVPA